ncbi:MAG: hypothetical protein WCK18_15815 [Prolixibacteraceae bacterium]
MKITLTREHKALLLQALSDGFIYDQDLNTIKGVETFIPDRPMSRQDYGRLLLKLKCQNESEDESDDENDDK